MEPTPTFATESGGMPDDRHPIQKLMDNPWLLLFLGVVVPTLSYTVWGWIELATMPPATLP